MSFTEIYSLLNAGKIIAGFNSIETIAREVTAYNAKKVLIITDQGVWNAGLIEKPKSILESAGIRVYVINNTPPEPEVEQVNIIFNAAKELECDLIIGIGGGSSMDVAKIVAVMLTNAPSLSEILAGAKIEKRGIPAFMVPTTAGTGSEVTPNAIFLVPEKELKIGVVSEKLLPDCVILDPVLTIGLPKAITAATGMDALSHAIECYISKKANPFSDTFALKAINLIARSIRQAYNNGQDLEARHDMLLGAMFGGLCISTSSTVAVHALAYPLGGKYRIPHGLSNAILLPHVMNFNMDAAAAKFKDIAIAMELGTDGLSTRQAAKKMIENLYSLIRDLNIQVNLKEMGIRESDIDSMAEAALKVTRLLDNNPKPMNRNDIYGIYKKVFPG
ncbi:alcohol dehydrogenase iron-type [Lucifera butyrica]|uniref:Alcohol dehydrogenase iron-type n=1 Tax=Lucifera butyrica TaxID=1351585 RepID=A0A498RBP5_9FIRM|nr:iron-containing alcohol dehydrogenase [Lucifera butyrica]VBB07682.1 alcohol dehydrogenase iron-type [Lucifera butyrica]